MERGPRWLGPLLFIAFAAIYFITTTHDSYASSDFRPYYRAAQHIVHGESPYLADGYIYPPLLAFLLSPLTALDYVSAQRCWFVFSQLALVAAAILLWRRFGRDWASACCIALVWTAGGAAQESLSRGQVGPLLTLLVVLAFTGSSAAVAVGFALKLFPGLLGVAVLLRREWRAISAMMLTAAAALILPWIAVATILRGPPGIATGGAWAGTAAILSWSLPSVVLRILDPPTQAYPLPVNWEHGMDLYRFRLPAGESTIGITVAALTLGIGLLLLLRTVRNRLSDDQVPWAMAALISLALVATPVGWSHYQILQYPGVALLLIHAWRKREWRELSIGLALGALLYPIPAQILWAYYLRYHAWTAHSLGTLYIWTSVSPFASLGLFAIFLRELRKARSTP